MWNPFVVNDCNYLIKFHNSSVVEIYLTDFKTIWVEKSPAEKLVKRFQEMNPLFDDSLSSDDILQKIVSLTKDIKDAATLTKETTEIVLDIKCKLEEFSVRCKFCLSEGDRDMYFNEFTLPLMQTVQYLEMRQKKMFDLLEKKDKEILEHQMESGEISRKSLVTKKFDRKVAMENVPEQLFVNVFGKYKVFYDTFAKHFGSAASVSPKIKLENTEGKPTKKLKVEKSN